VQGKSKEAPPYEKVLAHFLRKRGVRSTIVPANFPLGYAQELGANKIRVQATNGLFWPGREAKSENEVEMIGRALRITEKGLKRAIEVLKASQPAPGKRLRWSGKTLTRRCCAQKLIPRFYARAEFQPAQLSQVAIRRAIRMSAALVRFTRIH
jgi:Xaa-Pro aminopeptidase